MTKKYKVIYADPPWRYNVWKGQGMVERHYPTMELDEIKALPVGELADKDCVLFLWATLPMLQEALQVIKAWGFEYKTTAFVWIKLNRQGSGIFWGLGFWTRSNAEVCLLATKGHPKRQARNIHQVFISPAIKVSPETYLPCLAVAAQRRAKRLLIGSLNRQICRFNDLPC